MRTTQVAGISPKQATIMEEVLSGLATNGFPVVVAAYLLVRMEKELRALREAINQLRHCSVCRLSPKNPPEAECEALKHTPAIAWLN